MSHPLFETGNVLIHSLHGLGEVQSIQTREFLGEKADYAICTFREGELEMMVKLSGGHELFRSPIDADEANKVFDYLQEFDGKSTGAWKVRQRNNKNRLVSGDPFQLCEVVKTLARLSDNRRLNRKDQEHLDQARQLLAQELAYALERPVDEVDSRIAETCNLVDAPTAA